MKSISLMISALMVISLVSIMVATPVDANPDSIAVKLETAGDGSANWTTERAHTENYSVKLSAPGDVNSYSKVMVPYEGTLNSIESFTYKYNVEGELAPWSKRSIQGADATDVVWHCGFMMFEIDTDDDGERDAILISSTYRTAINEGWQTALDDTHMLSSFEETATTTLNFHLVYVDASDARRSVSRSLFGNWQDTELYSDMLGYEAGKTLGQCDVVNVSVEFGGVHWEITDEDVLAAATAGDYTITQDTVLSVYVDDLTINGVTYDLEATAGAIGVFPAVLFF